MSLAICRLCSREAPLRVSHIIPKFAIDWIKRTSATGYLRDAINPNLRRQDLAKAELLCDDCEQLLSRDERIFAERIFRPFLNEHMSRFRYEEWLKRFAVSLAWRTVAAGPPITAAEPVQFHDALRGALQEWSRYLLGKTQSPGSHTHHMLLVSYIDRAPGHLPSGFQTYLLRAVDATVVISRTSLFVYSKLPGIIFASHVIPNQLPGWRRTRILRKGEIGGGQVLSHSSSAHFFVDRASEVLRRSAVSSRQALAMRRDVLKDPERALGSKSYQAFLAEERLRALRRHNPLDPDWA